jgi:voltage-gated potassium channel
MWNHAIVIGYGNAGGRTVRGLLASGVPFIVIDLDEKKLDGVSFPYIVGDGTSEEILVQAGVEKALLVVVASDQDIKNIYTTLLVRRLNPSLVIFTRVAYANSVDKAYRAGSDRVFCLSIEAGRILAKMIISPEDYEKHSEELSTLPKGSTFHSYEVPRSSRLVGKSLNESGIRNKTGCMVVRIQTDSKLVKLPRAEDVIEPQSTLLIFGSAENIKKFKEMFE